MGLLKWPHEVDAPNIKYLHLQVVVEWHGIASSDTSLQLTLLTPSNEVFGVIIHRCLEESALPDFGLCVEYSVMASIRCCMEFLNDLQAFYHWYTPPQ